MPPKETDWQAHHFDTVVSTMDTAKDLLQHGTQIPFYVLADQQSSGRGRYARQWQSPKGNLYLTLVIPLTNLASAPFYAYITALSVLDAVRKLLPDEADNLTLKWPNDILLESKKTGGILLEVQDKNLIIGIGLNITEHPEDMSFPATHLCSTAEPIEPKNIATMITHYFDKWQGVFEKEGFMSLRSYWLENRDPKHLHIAINPNRGNPEKPSHGKPYIEGRFHDLDGQGNLILENLDDKGNMTLTKHITGDVFFI